MNGIAEKAMEVLAREAEGYVVDAARKMMDGGLAEWRLNRVSRETQIGLLAPNGAVLVVVYPDDSDFEADGEFLVRAEQGEI